MPHSHPESSGGFEEQLEELLAECLQAPEEERRARLDAACAAHPELAPRLQERARLLQAFGEAFARPAAPLPRAIGDFELGRKLGQGGMGVVYEARQITLGRTVALKLIRPDQVFFDGARERFRREAQAIAKLSHPNIVPIFVVGEEDGAPYFAMEFVRGCTLAQALAEVSVRAPESLVARDLERVVARGAGDEPGESAAPKLYAGSWIDACVELATQIATALEHAHAHGIVHRDVKPSNIALAPDGRARLLDFGLTSRSGSDRMTRTGSQVGTILYMPPEQMRRTGPVDARADVYALGVVLYEMLSLQPPYRGDDALSIMRAALDAKPDPLRGRNRRVPSDLETVCQVAMDPDPARRYRSAAAFARDLQNVAQRRPIEARPPGPLVRARRFAERHPARAASLALGLALVGGIPLALFVQKSLYAADLEDALGRARKADADKAVALKQEQDSAHELERSLAFVTGLFARGAPSVAKGEPFTVRDLLELGAGEVEAGLADHPLARARIQMSVGVALLELGDHERARTQFERASAIYRDQLVPDHPTLYGCSLRRLADALANAGDPAALETYDRAIAALAHDLPEAHHERAQALAGRAWLRATSRDLERARDDLEAARAEALLSVAGAEESLAHFDARFASLYASEGRFVEAGALADSAVRSMQAERGGASPAIVEALNVRGWIDKQSGDLSAAETAYTLALDYANWFWKREGIKQAELYLNLAGVAAACREGAREIELLRRARVIFERELGSSHATTALCSGNLAGAFTRQKQYAEAEALYPRVIEMQIQAFGPRHVFLGYSLKNLATCAAARGDSRRAADLYYEAGRHLLDCPGQESAAIEALATSAYQSSQCGELGAAEDVLREALGHAQEVLSATPPGLHVGLAAVLEAQGRGREAEEARSKSAQR